MHVRRATSVSAHARPLSLQRLRQVQVRVAVVALTALAFLFAIGWLGNRLLAVRTAALVGWYLEAMRYSAAQVTGDQFSDMLTLT